MIKMGCVGEVRQVADDLGLTDLLGRPYETSSSYVLLKIFRDPGIQIRVNIDPVTMYPPYPDLNPFYKESDEDGADEKKGKPGETPARVASSYSTKSDTPAMVFRDENGNEISEADYKQNLKDTDDEEGWTISNTLDRLRHIYIDSFVFIATWWVFDYIVYGTILVSSVLLAAESPARDIPPAISREIIFLGGLICNGIFVVEFLAKVTAFGLFFPNKKDFPSYFGDPWNRVDFLVLLLSIFDTLTIYANVEKFVGSNILRILRLFRAFRPLKMIHRNKSMRTIVSALISSMKPIFYAVLFLLLIITVFGVMGVALYKNTFKYCTDGSLDGTLKEGKLECSGFLNHTGDYLVPRSWINPPWNFDTFPVAVLSLLRVVTLKWMAIWYSAQDSVGVDIQPVLNNNSVAASIYLFTFVFAGSFFALNLFVSFIVDGFYTAQGVDAK